MKKKIKRFIYQINFNWRQAGSINDDAGEDYDMYIVGNSGVVSITNMTPQGEPGYIGTEFYDVEFDDGRLVTIYNPNQVFMKPLGMTS